MVDESPEVTRTEPPLCGRTTKSGKPCANRLDRGAVACRIHADETDIAVRDAFLRGWGQGWTAGCESGRSSAKMDEEFRLAREQREADERARFRERDQFGQLVVVDNDTGKALTYRWVGEKDLEIGEMVVVPPNWLVQRSRICAVIAIGSSYDGELQNILRRARPQTAM